jgi:hypothetical protein
MKTKTKFTSVYLIEDVYNKFKSTSIEGSLTLQKFVNRSMDLYNKDVEFKNKINNHLGLTSSGSKY